jgi:replication-associated recombination protein RarA
MTLTLHPTSRALVERLAIRLPQSLLLSGERGVGLHSIATHLSHGHIMAIVEPTDAKEKVDHERGTISVEVIRRLYEQTRARHTKRQVVIIDDADRMSHGAQNAFLKLLEEPNENIHFILTSHHPKRLLPTILSRVQESVILPITEEQTADFISQLAVPDAKKQAQLRYIGNGLPAKLMRLTQDDDYFADEARIMSDARTFIQGTSFEKLVVVNSYAASRDKALALLDSALVILRRSVSSHPDSQLVHQMERLLNAHEAIDANHNVKLQLTQVVL